MRLAAWCLAHFALFLLPVLGLAHDANLSISFVADYFLYLPAIGLLLAGVALLRVAPLASARIRTAIGVLLLVGGTVKTLTYLPEFRSGESFWRATLEASAVPAAAEAGLGRWYESRGDAAGAYRHYTAAHVLNPDSPDARTDAARAAARKGRVAEAESLLPGPQALPMIAAWAGEGAHHDLALECARTGGRRDLQPAATLEDGIE